MALTKKDLLAIRNDLNQLRQDIHGDMLELESRIDKKIDQKIDQKVDQGVAILKVLIEDVRSDIKLLAEGREFPVEKLGMHEKKIDNHEGRITTLEDVVYTKR